MKKRKHLKKINNKIDKPVGRPTMKKEKVQITNVRNEKSAKIMIIRNNKFAHIHLITETKCTYSSKGKKPSKLNQDEIDNLNSPIAIKEIKFAIKKFLNANYYL